MNNYDHHTAIYLLLLERLKPRSLALEANNPASASSTSNSTKHPSLEQQRRRPSSIAEQAMRKISLGSSGTATRSDLPISPRHHASVTERNYESTHQILGNTPLMSMMTLRETNIRDPPTSLQLSQTINMRNSPSFNQQPFMKRDREYYTPFMAVNPQSSQMNCCYMGSANTRESNSLLNRNSIGDGSSSILGSLAYANSSSHRVPSSRLLSNSIDQRILKQSTEDCRRLLQQVSYTEKF